MVVYRNSPFERISPVSYLRRLRADSGLAHHHRQRILQHEEVAVIHLGRPEAGAVGIVRRAQRDENVEQARVPVREQRDADRDLQPRGAPKRSDAKRENGECKEQRRLDSAFHMVA